MSGLISPERIIGGEVYEREIPGVGLLRFEQCAPGEWLTKAGAPAKVGHRCYRIGEQVLASVSDVVGTLNKGALMDWCEKHTAIGMRQAVLTGEIDDTIPDDELAGRLALLGLGASAARDAGAYRGHLIHSVFETLAAGDEPPNPAEFPDVARPWLQGATRAWLLMAPEVEIVEGAVVNSEHGYAGRFDLIARIDGKRTLVDYKTSARGKVFDGAHYQTKLYAMALEQSGIEPVEDVLIVGVDGEGGVQLVPCEASEDDASGLVAVYQSRKRINAAMATTRKAAKAAARAAA